MARRTQPAHTGVGSDAPHAAMLAAMRDAPAASVDLVRLAPRVLGIGFALFVSLFALDVFDTPAGVGVTAVALLIHLVPTFVLLLTVALAWRREWLGALVFGVLGSAYLAFVRGFPVATYVVIAGPPLVIAALYLASWQRRRSRAPAGDDRSGGSP